MTSSNGQADGGDRHLTWSTPVEAASLIVRGATVRTAAPLAAFVGTVLSLVNQGQIVASGQASVATWIRIGVNYAIPFTVASIGYVAPFRSRRNDEADSSADLDELDATVSPAEERRKSNPR